MKFQHPVTISVIDVFPVRAEGGVSPKMALGTMPTRPGLLVRITDRDGCVGWGEIWANFPPRANIHKAHLVEDVIANRLTGFKYIDPLEVDEYLRSTLSTYFLHVGQLQVFEHILAGLDVALWDLALRSAGKSFQSFAGLSSATVPVYASSINRIDIEDLIPLHARLGQSGFKLKLGLDEDADRAFIQEADQLMPPKTRVMVDSNQVWELSQAQRMLAYLEDFDPLFAEEPIPANCSSAVWEDLAKSTSVPLAGGENLYGVDEFLHMANAGLRYVQPDVAKWGGISGVLSLTKMLPLDVQIWPHFMGTAIGQMAAISVTAAIGKSSVCEMDVNENSLRTSLCGNALRIEDGRVNLPDSPGVVVPPLQEHLEEFTETV